jgi:hypothetical protein
MSIAVTIRPATAADADAIPACLRSAFEPYRENCTADAYRDTVLTAKTIHDRLASMSVLVAVSLGRLPFTGRPTHHRWRASS